MRTYRNLFEELINENGIREDIFNASLGKRGESYVKRRTGNLNGIDRKKETTPQVEKTIQDVRSLYINGFGLREKETEQINDGFRLKKRDILKPVFFPEQIMTHGIVRVMEKVMTKGMYEYTCGSIPGRGTHYGKESIERWIKHDPANIKYVGQMDIKKFFASVSRRRLKKMLKRYIKDKRFLAVVFKFLDIFIEGLALGYFISQWFANFILQPLDHYIKQLSLLDVKKDKELRYAKRMERKGITDYVMPKYPCGAIYYIRYMDDMVIYGNVKKELHLIVKRIGEYLKEKLGLILKETYQVFRFDYIDKKDGRRKGRPLDFLGFLFYRDKTILRKSNMLRATRKAKRLGKKSQINWHDASSMLSSMGWVKHTDTYNMYLERIKPYVDIRKLKRIVGKHQRKVNERERMAKGKFYALPC